MTPCCKSFLVVAVITSSEHARDTEDLKHVVHLLHAALHLPEHHLLQERHLLERMDNIKQELSPLEQVTPERWVGWSDGAPGVYEKHQPHSENSH